MIGEGSKHWTGRKRWPIPGHLSDSRSSYIPSPTSISPFFFLSCGTDSSCPLVGWFLPAQKRRGWLISLFDDIFRFRTWISFLSSFPDRLMKERDLRFPIRVGLVNLSCRWFDLITCRWFRCKWLIRWNPSFRLVDYARMWWCFS